MKRRWITTLFAPIALASSMARADVDPSVGRADALFTDAKALRDAGKYPEACAKFAESDRLAPGIGVKLYLADCYEHEGKTASAWITFRAAEARAHERSDDRARVASARADAIEPRVSRITFSVARSLRRHGVEVSVDGGAGVRPEDYERGVVADPGDHLVALKLGGRIAHLVTAHVSPGGVATSVALTEPPLPPLPHTVPPAPPERAEPLPAADPRLTIGVGLATIGAIGIGVGAALLATKNRSMSDGAPNGNPSFDQNAATASTAGFVVGGAAFASIVVLYLTAPKRTETALTLSPASLAGGMGASLRLVF